MTTSSNGKHNASPIRGYLINGVCTSWMARETGIPIRTLWRIKSGESKNVPSRTWDRFVALVKKGEKMKTTVEANEERYKRTSKRMKGKRIAKCKLSPAKARQIRVTYQKWTLQDDQCTSTAQRQLALAYGVSVHTIRAVVYDSIWKDV